MIITLNHKRREFHKCMDIQVNEEQKIMDTLQILAQAGLISDRNGNTAAHIYSERNKQYINTQLTYNQAMIFHGDNLILDGGGSEHEE